MEASDAFQRFELASTVIYTSKQETSIDFCCSTRRLGGGLASKARESGKCQFKGAILASNLPGIGRMLVGLIYPDLAQN